MHSYAADGATAAIATPTGEDLFLHGHPSRGMPPCQGCHGADANGPSTAAAQYAAYPDPKRIGHISRVVGKQPVDQIIMQLQDLAVPVSKGIACPF